MASTPNLEVIGPYRGPTGYDRHTRAFLKQLANLGRPVQLSPLQHWSVDLPVEMLDPWYETLLRPIDTHAALHFTMPTHCWPRPGKPNVNYTMFEADRIPAEWAARAAAVDCVALPTEACRRAWMESGVPERKLRIAPLGVDGEFFREPAPPLGLQAPDGRPLDSFAHRFLNIAEMRPRKNHTGLVRAWLSATAAADDAVLILKCTGFQAGAFEAMRDDLLDVQRELCRSLADAAPVILFSHVLSDAQMRSLYATATHYISMSHGEGWDLPMMESAAAGLTLIAPDHSAYSFYLTPQDALLIPSPSVPAAITGRVGAEDRVFFDGLRWWEPDHEAAVETIRGVIHRGLRPPDSPRERIIRDYTWNAAGRQLLSVVDEFA